MPKFNLEKENEKISDICNWIEEMNRPNPENPGGISELAYHTVMDNLHDLSWKWD